MSFSRDRLIRGAATVSESAWLFAVLSVVSIVIGLEGSALNWPSVLAILGLSVLVSFLVLARRAHGGIAGTRATNLVRAVVYSVVVYVVVASHFSLGSVGIDLAWITKLTSESAPGDLGVRVIAGGLIAALLLWRGSRIAKAFDPVAGLMYHFRIGLVAMAAAMVFDILHPAEVNTLPISFVFFASGLGGLSVGNLMPKSQESAKSRTWLSVIAAMVAGVLLMGLAVSFLHRGVQSLLTDAVATALKGAFWVIVAPLFLLLEQFTNLVTSFFGRPFDPTLAEGSSFEIAQTSTTPQFPSDNLQTMTTTPEVVEAAPSVETFGYLSTLLGALFVLLGAVIVLVLLMIVFRQFNSMRRHGGSRGDPETIEEGVNLVSDIADLLRKLIPDWRMARRKKAAFRLPDGPPGVVTVLRIYYDLLTLSKDKGYPRPSNATATEFQSTMERILPVSLVRMATAAFNRACYGYHPATEEQIGQMRASLARIGTPGRMVSRRRQGFGTLPPADLG